MILKWKHFIQINISVQGLQLTVHGTVVVHYIQEEKTG